MAEHNPRTVPYITASAIGVAYGIVCQLFIRAHVLEHLYGAMSFGFVFILPFVLGFITLQFATVEQRRSWAFRIFAPWGPISVCLLFSLIVGWEGAICLIMAAVVYLPLATIGGVISGLILARIDRNRLSSSVLCAMVLVLPAASAFVENYFALPQERSIVHTSITIQAPPSVVWHNIIRVPRITEPLGGYFYKMGFPKPLEATLSYEGVGGVRHASFERGLVFIETVDTWDPEKTLSFSIATDPQSIPPTTLDEHVVVGGRYFDVLRGTYEIVPDKDGGCVLHLSSETRVSTRFNFYAGLWAKLLMSDIQNTILSVLKDRAESGSKET